MLRIKKFRLRRLAKEDASITHANPVVADAAATYVVAIVALFKGKSKEVCLLRFNLIPLKNTLN